MRGSESQSPIAMLSIIEESDLKGASILMKRRIGDDDFSKALRALMGEDNIFKNYTNTITKMAAVIENHRLFADIRGMGIEQGWIVHGDMIPTGEGDQWVAIHSPDKFKPDYMLHGLYVRHEVREALEFLLQPKKTDVGGLMGFIFSQRAHQVWQDRAVTTDTLAELHWQPSPHDCQWILQRQRNGYQLA